MMLRGGGGLGHDANSLSMNFEPSFLIIGLELVAIHEQV